MSDIDLTKRAVIVTGAAQGLGEAIARGLAAAGARVAVSDIKADQLRQVVDDLAEAHGADHVMAAVCDISDNASTERFVAEATEQFGRIDVLVNNAGLGCGAVRPDFMSNPVPIWRLDPAEWRRVVEINSIGTFNMVRGVVPALVAQGWGRVINVTTTFQTMLARDFGAYGPSKAAIEAMTSILVDELDGTGVTVNVVVPGGPADTEQIPDGMVANRDELLRPGVMVPAIRWLCSDESAEVSGRRFSAAEWDDDLPWAQAVEKSTHPVAWRQLVEPIIMPDGRDGPHA